MLLTSAVKLLTKHKDLLQFHTEQVLNKSEIINNPTHDVLYDYFNLMSSGNCFRSPACKTNRRKFGFIPEAIRHVNRCSKRNDQFTLYMTDSHIKLYIPENKKPSNLVGFMRFSSKKLHETKEHSSSQAMTGRS